LILVHNQCRTQGLSPFGSGTPHIYHKERYGKGLYGIGGVPDPNGLNTCGVVQVYDRFQEFNPSS
jgi:hypothetical protein